MGDLAPRELCGESSFDLIVNSFSLLVALAQGLCPSS